MNWLYNKNNLDEIEGNTIFIEYTTLNDQDTEYLGSIFEIKSNMNFSMTTYEVLSKHIYKEYSILSFSHIIIFPKILI